MSGYGPDFDYLGNVQRLGLVMQALESVDLAGIVETTSMAHAVGWVVDPTKYRDALQRGDMDAMRDLAVALAPAAEVWRERIAPKIAVSSDGASA